MKAKAAWIAMGTLSVLLGVPSPGQSRGKGTGKSKAPPAKNAAVSLDLVHSAEGSIPGGATAVAGKWEVGATKTLRALPVPLRDNWLEFGPEVREKGAAIRVMARAPGRGRIQSRFGAGLHGKNGFQIRTAPARHEIELVRRGAVILKCPFKQDPDKALHLELIVKAERQHWIVVGRAWPEGGVRPDKALFTHKVYPVELELPLAGRAVLFATPFSGEAVEFLGAELPPP